MHTPLQSTHIVSHGHAAHTVATYFVILRLNIHGILWTSNYENQNNLLCQQFHYTELCYTEV